MFTYACIAAAFLLLTASCKEYSLIAFFVFMEFALHKIIYVVGVEYSEGLQGAELYVAYMAAEALALAMMYRYQAHLFITALIFTNLLYNFLTTLHHLGITAIDFHGYYPSIVQPIMILELLYLAGISAYVRRSLKKHGFINVDDISRTFRIRSRVSSRGVS